MRLRWTIVALLLGLALPGGLAAQTAPTGLQLARGFLDRTVRVIARQVPGLPGESGYGLVVGERTGTQGGTVLVIVTPDHLVRDPQRPDARFDPPSVVFFTDQARPVRAQLLDQRLPPEEGDLAVLTVPKPATFRARPAAAANTGLTLPGAPAWQVGRAADWTPAPVPGRFTLRERSGWLSFDGLDNAPAAAGAPVTTERGLAGLLTGASSQDRQVSRVVPVELIAARLRAWNLPFELGAPEGSAALPGGLAGLTAPSDQSGNRLGAPVMPSAPTETSVPADSRPAAPTSGPSGLVLMLPAEAAARTSWTPPGARISPWLNTPARLFGAARQGAPQIGMLPPGRSLPPQVLASGAYEVGRKLDGGAWFLVEIGGQPIGYVAGSDVVEVWPMQETSGMAGGKVVREWTAAGGKSAVLRDAGNAFELETTVACRAAFCESIVVFTPAPPNPGAIVPSFQSPARTGVWKEGDVVSLRLQLPRRIAETAGTQLLACVGRQDDCEQVTLLPPP